MKLIHYLTVAAFLLMNFNVKADELISIYLSNSDNSPVRVETADVSSIKFNKTMMFVDTNDGQSISYSFSEISKIVFDGGEASIEAIDAKTVAVNVFPNPVKDKLIIEGADELSGSEVFIYSMTGVLCAQCSQWNGEAIDVSGFNAGVYFVKINSITLKFIKQ